MTDPNRYTQIIQRIFMERYHAGADKVPFEREALVKAAKDLRIALPKNLGDILYSFRYRTMLPDSIASRAPTGKTWIIRPAGKSRYCFVATFVSDIVPNRLMAETKVANATPGVIEMYALSDEQALLAKLRYNRLIDVFTGVTCYSLQNHLRTAVPKLGQVETDELYVGVDKRGVHYIIPVQAKGGKDKLNIVQIEQDIAMCKAKFKDLPCRPVAAQFIDDDLIALFEFELTGAGVALSVERHYRLVPPEDLTQADLSNYLKRTEQGQ